MSRGSLAQILSGGQTGVDRAALEFAVARGVPYTGWCPRGGLAEDLGEAPGLLALYPELRETPEADPAQRTLWNVRDSDATLVLRLGAAASPGTDATELAAAGLARPIVLVDLQAPDAGRMAVAQLLLGRGRVALNVAGPRESEAPGIQAAARRFLEQALAPLLGAGR